MSFFSSVRRAVGGSSTPKKRTAASLRAKAAKLRKQADAKDAKGAKGKGGKKEPTKREKAAKARKELTDYAAKVRKMPTGTKREKAAKYEAEAKLLEGRSEYKRMFGRKGSK